MDERILFDQIKRKEADIIHTLQNIAEAAFITESLQRSGTEAEAEVDSDLREMAKSTHGLMEDNSEPDFEDDAVEINDTDPELLEVRSDHDPTTEKESCLFSSEGQDTFTENPQTVIPFACRLRRPTVNRHDHGTLAEKSLRSGERDTNIMEPNLRLFCH